MLIGGLLRARSNASPTNKSFKSQTFLEGSGHSNFLNPFENGKSFHNKSMPKRIGTLNPLNSWPLAML